VFAFIFRRLIQAVLVVILVTILLFFAMRFLPGDPILLYLTGQDVANITPEMRDTLAKEHGLDKPLISQYGNWMFNLLQGDLGKSINYPESLNSIFRQRLAVTLYIGCISTLLSWVLGILSGLIAAIKRGTWIDTLLSSIANFGIAAPNFWLAMLLIYFFGIKLNWLPVFGYTSPLDDFWLSTRQIIMPVFCLVASGMCGLARQTRSGILEIIRQDYIRTAFAKGLQYRTIVIKHILKNGLIPSVTLMGMGVSMTIGGSVIIENVFSIPGMGRLLITGVLGHDYQVVQAGVLIIAIAGVFTNLLVDISYGWLDPRIRYN